MATSTSTKPDKVDMLKAIHKALEEYSEPVEFESVWSDEAEVLEIRVMHAHHVDIYKVEVKYDTTFSG